MVDGIDIAALRRRVGSQRRTRDAMGDFPVRALAATLDRPTAPQPGEALPLGWQWLYFLETPKSCGTGADGHPALGEFLPPIALPRRMWAAGRMETIAPIRLGTPAERVSTIRTIDAKSGATGALVFVTLEHEIVQEEHTCLREEQTLVYRALPAGPSPLPPGEAAPRDAGFVRPVRPDPVLLFRYSALTYNGHRIHYDRPYAVEQEHYPALVVHGPLLVTLLLDLVAEHCPGETIARCTFRALRPTFDDAPFDVCGRRDGDRVALWTRDRAGFVGMRAEAMLA